jgi:phosphoribosylamine-glycine ligase
VLTVTGLGETVGEAARRSTDACELITFSGKTYRRDIGWRETREARAGAARG